MKECLGYDIDGRPLRAGDRVVMVTTKNSDFDFLLGEIVTIVGPSSIHDDSVIIDVLVNGRPSSLVCSTVRKLPPKQSDNETTTWESIEQLTGWVPEGASHV